MKLRNKKTGEIVDTLCPDDITKGLAFGIDKHDGNPTMAYYNSLTKLNEDWEDYEPLIKDEKIRKAVRAWAGANNLDDGISYDDETFGLVDARASITFKKPLGGLSKYKWNTITELCGEEAE